MVSVFVRIYDGDTANGILDIGTTKKAPLRPQRPKRFNTILEP